MNICRNRSAKRHLLKKNERKKREAALKWEIWRPKKEDFKKKQKRLDDDDTKERRMKYEEADALEKKDFDWRSRKR